jgi:hypothetical protein
MLLAWAIGMARSCRLRVPGDIKLAERAGIKVRRRAVTRLSENVIDALPGAGRRSRLAPARSGARSDKRSNSRQAVEPDRHYLRW